MLANVGSQHAIAGPLLRSAYSARPSAITPRKCRHALTKGKYALGHRRPHSSVDNVVKALVELCSLHLYKPMHSKTLRSSTSSQIIQICKLTACFVGPRRTQRQPFLRTSLTGRLPLCFTSRPPRPSRLLR